MAKKENTVQPGMSEDTKTILVVLGLVFFYPVGLILMFMWMKDWPRWVKVLLALPVIVMLFAIVSAILLVAINPRDMQEKARQAAYESTMSANPSATE